MSLAILFHALCAQHVSDINIATLLLNYHIGRVVLGSMCVGDLVWLDCSGIHSNPTTPKLQNTSNQRSMW